MSIQEVSRVNDALRNMGNPARSVAGFSADATLHAPRPDPLPPSVGERNSSARMTADKVRALRFAYDVGGRLASLADAFGIDTRTARHIAQRTSWRHVP